MKAWTRAIIGTYCGGCGGYIPAGDPMVAIRLRGMKRPLWRCVLCGDAGAPPPDLPDVVARTPSPFKTDFVHIRTAANALPFDFRKPDREPGSDDD